MATPKERRERERLELRGRILDVAREMFVKEGFEAVTMRSLAKRIEYSPTAIYLHFKDKEALLAELCNEDLREMHDALYAVNVAHGTVERLYAVAKTYVEFSLSHPAQYQLVFMTPRPAIATTDKPEANQRMEQLAYGTLRTNWQELIKTGLLRDEIADPDLLAQTWLCGLHGIVAMAIIMGECPLDQWREPKTLAVAFVDNMLRGILKNPNHAVPAPTTPQNIPSL